MNKQKLRSYLQWRKPEERLIFFPAFFEGNDVVAFIFEPIEKYDFLRYMHLYCREDVNLPDYRFDELLEKLWQTSVQVNFDDWSYYDIEDLPEKWKTILGGYDIHAVLGAFEKWV